MQTKLIVVSLLLLVTKVLAGGYAGALERVWLYYAYQIDGLNDPASQTLGWKCLSWDDQAHKCRPSKKGMNGWVMCKGSAAGKRCTFSELLNFLGGAGSKDQLMADSKGNLLPLTDTNPDPEQTAKKVYAHFQASPKGKVPDWQPYRILLNSDENYIRNIRKVSNVVKKAADDGKNTAANAKHFDGFAETTTQIKNARIGDHGSYLITATEDALKGKGITVETESIGSGHSPIDSTKAWNTVDWEKTMSGAVSSGKFTTGEIMTITADVRKQFYNNDKTAADHRVVIRAFKTSETKAKGCL